ncbi:MAG: hypothetical protein HGA75_05180 [Thiobacillus sp.]|nr:hypothetical protein [Thiobacillus sp.]
MKTRLIQIAILLLLLGGTGIAGAAESASTQQTQANAPETSQAAAGEQRDVISWQRVGAPEEAIG